MKIRNIEGDSIDVLMSVHAEQCIERAPIENNEGQRPGKQILSVCSK
jgi:hypothetical protein